MLFVSLAAVFQDCKFLFGNHSTAITKTAQTGLLDRLPLFTSLQLAENRSVYLCLYMIVVLVYYTASILVVSCWF